MLQYTIAVEGMACSMCEAHVNDAVRKAFPIKKVTSSHSKGQTQILCENRLDEHPPRKSSRLSRSRRLWRSYFAAKAGLFWNGPATGVLDLAPIRYCFSQSVQKRIGASLLRSHSMVPLFGWKRKPRGRPCVLCTPTWESPSPVPGMILVC